MLTHLFILGMREKSRKVKELAVAANETAARTLEDMLGLSLRVFNTSEDLSRVNATVQETKDLLHNSTMTSTSVTPVLKACSMPIGRELSTQGFVDSNLRRGATENASRPWILHVSQGFLAQFCLIQSLNKEHTSFSLSSSCLTLTNPCPLVFISSLGWKENERHGNASQPSVRSIEAFENAGRKPEQKPVGDQAAHQPGPEASGFGELGLGLLTLQLQKLRLLNTRPGEVGGQGALSPQLPCTLYRPRSQ